MVHIGGRRDIEVLDQCCGPDAEPDTAELDKQLECLLWWMQVLAQWSSRNGASFTFTIGGWARLGCLACAGF